MRAAHFGTVWGVVGFVALLVQAIYRLAGRAIEPIVDGHMTGLHWLLYIVSVSVMAYSEGYRAFHLQASPRVVARAFHLARDPRPLRVALAPLFCMGLFGATRRRIVIAWSVYVGILVLVLAVRQLSQPWRGMIDAGVVVGLSGGVISVVIYFLRALSGRSLPVGPDLPEAEVHNFEQNPAGRSPV